MTDETQPVDVPEVFITPEIQSEAPVAEAPAVETDTTETETDEQKNERALKERRAASERRARGVQARFDELTRDKYAERARAERLERELEVVRQQLMPRQSEPQAEQPPQREQFQTYDEYIEARADWRAEQKLKAGLKEWQEAQQRQAAEFLQKHQHEARIREDHNAIAQAAEKFRTVAKDYDEVVQSLDFEAPPAMERAIADAENPAAVLYALGRQPDVARRIASLDPVRQAKAIGAIEAFLRQQQSSPQVSKAPPPGNPVGGKPNAPSSRDPMQARTVEEFMKLREAQVRAERQR